MGTASLTIPTIFTAVDRFSSTVGKMGNNLSLFNSKAQRHYLKLYESADRVAKTSKTIAQSSLIGGLAITTPLILASKEAVNFQKQMGNVSTLVDTNKESMTSMGSEVLKIFRKVPVPLEELTHGLYMIRSDAIPAAQAMDVLKSSALLGVTGLSTTAQAANVVTSAFNVFKDEGLSATQIAGALFETVKNGKTTMAQIEEAFGATAPLVHSAGVSLKDFLSATAALTNSGMPAAQSMNEIRAAVTSLEKPSKVMTQIFHGLGVTGKGADGVKQLISKFGNLGTAMTAIEDKGNKMNLNMAKAWRNVMAFGAVTLLTGMTKNNYLANLDSMKNGVTDFGEAQKKQLSTAAAQMQLLKNNVKSFAITIGTKLLPELTRLAEKLSPILDRMINWSDNHPRLVSWIVKLTAGVGALMLVVSPLATMVGLAANGVKLWSQANLWFSTTSTAATLAMEAQTTAMSAQAVTVTGFGSAISGVTAEFGAANVAATGFFATLSEFVLPAALVALSGLAIWKVLDHPKWMDGTMAGKDWDKPKYFDPNTYEGKMSPFSNQSEENAYQKWWIQQDKKGVSRASLERVNFAPIWDKDHPSIFDFNALKRTNPNSTPTLPVLTNSHSIEQSGKSDSTIHIVLHDPTAAVKEVKTSPGMTIPVKVTSTQGAR